jgi:hypothetical protein
LKGFVDVRCYHEHGSYAGICKSARTVLQDENDNIWTMDGRGGSGRVFEMILSGFKFSL